MESRIQLTAPGQNGVPATLRFEDGQLIIFAKSKWIAFWFGMIGQAMASEKERFRFRVCDVKTADICQKPSGKSIFKLVTSEGKKFKFVFQAGDPLAKHLAELFGRIEERKAEQEA